mmetsp:Transcript_19752/g.58764  ORF Transcript_19752/g.58764 Transcript_19752/m.58764 type:complete len:240 (-) Transcript_19752:31-750(-)
MADNDDDAPACRICFGTEDEPGDELIQPCACAGTMAFVHRSCLDEVRVKGFDPSSLSRCGLCKTEYVTEAETARFGGPKTELALVLLRYVGLRVLAFLAAAGVLGFVPRAVLGRHGAEELRVCRGPVRNHFSVGSLATLALSGGYAIVAFVGPLNLAHHVSFRRRFSSKSRDDSLQIMLVILIVVGIGYLLYHLCTAVYNLARTGLPVAVDNVRHANEDVRRKIAEKYKVVDRRKARAG